MTVHLNNEPFKNRFSLFPKLFIVVVVPFMMSFVSFSRCIWHDYHGFWIHSCPVWGDTHAGGGLLLLLTWPIEDTNVNVLK